ncbi:MAG: Flp family type IVb pilin [Tepidisphaeraceae bacterium]|jgi:Flp pilus assembly pilin Flp
MKPIWMLQHLLRDESSAEALEYALVAGMIVLMAISVITRIGIKVFGQWTSLNSSM